MMVRATMMRVCVLHAVIAASLSACAGLGSLKYQGIAGSAAPPSLSGLPYGTYSKVTVSTSADISKFVSSGNGVYVLARLCPAPGAGRVSVIAVGPFETDRPQTYDVYLVAKHPEAGVRYSDTFLADHLPYDLGSDERDVCIAFEAPGYPAAARSGELRIPGQVFGHNPGSE